MRICLVANAGHPDVVKWARILSRQGIDVHLATFSMNPIEGVAIHRLSGDPTRSKFSYLTAIPELRRLYQRLKPDVVNAFPASGMGTMATFAGMKPLVISIAGSDVLVAPNQSLIMRYILCKVMRNADMIVAIAPHLADAAENLGGPKERIKILPYMGIDLKFWIHGGIEARPDNFYAVSTRGLHAFHRHDIVIAAMALVSKVLPDAHFDFIGQGTAENEIKSYAEALCLTNVVGFPGVLPVNKVANYLRRSHIYISLCPTDGVSSSLLEAMATGAWPIVFNSEANQWWIEHGRNGFLVNEHDEDLVSRLLLNAYDDESMRRNGAAINREIIKKRANLETNVGELIGYYRSLLKT